ncbi:MAG TPA: GIY-YIG nuclease family protein [Egibacteraceae bacterium]|nr:GIY-YIG nuclease family protein [Egibacteraceae bacterium]
MPERVPPEVAAIRQGIEDCLDAVDDTGKVVGNASFGVYAFYDYDGEPIYVGQTSERLRVRIRRHLTNQRTDAVAMNVLDPFEVADVEMWPLFDLEGRAARDPQVLARLNAAEYTVYRLVLEGSGFSAVLNEKDMIPAPEIELPPSLRRRIVPPHVWELRSHPDVRIARRASTIAALARVISERKVSVGLRRTLLTQARRIERLAADRLSQAEGEIPVEAPGEETGELRFWDDDDL